MRRAPREGLPFVNPVDASGRFAGTGWDAIDGRTVFVAEGSSDDGYLAAAFEGVERVYHAAAFKHVHADHAPQRRHRSSSRQQPSTNP